MNSGTMQHINNIKISKYYGPLSIKIYLRNSSFTSISNNLLRHFYKTLFNIKKRVAVLWPYNLKIQQQSSLTNLII